MFGEFSYSDLFGQLKVFKILGEVHPSALYHLALLSKQFYALLSSEAARTIWKTSRENHVFKYRPDGAITVDEAGVDHGIGEKWQDADGKDWRLVTVSQTYFVLRSAKVFWTQVS